MKETFFLACKFAVEILSWNEGNWEKCDGGRKQGSDGMENRHHPGKSEGFFLIPTFDMNKSIIIIYFYKSQCCWEIVLGSCKYHECTARLFSLHCAHCVCTHGGLQEAGVLSEVTQLSRTAGLHPQVIPVHRVFLSGGRGGITII